MSGRLTLLDDTGSVVARLGDGTAATMRPGWPNQLDETGATVAPSQVDGVFGSPHAVAAAPDGSLVVAEFALAGRLIRLAPQGAPAAR